MVVKFDRSQPDTLTSDVSRMLNELELEIGYKVIQKGNQESPIMTVVNISLAESVIALGKGYKYINIQCKYFNAKKGRFYNENFPSDELALYLGK